MKRLLFFFLSCQISASSPLVAIIDSGVDIEHQELKEKIWHNSAEAENNIDSDGNGFVDDLWGWNFVDGNSQVFDSQYINYFSNDVYRFFEVRAKIIYNQASMQDMDWYNQVRQSEAFIHELNFFGNYAHGTHVAGITGRKSDVTLLPIKIIGANPVAKMNNTDEKNGVSLDPYEEIVRDVQQQTGLEGQDLLALIMQELSRNHAEEFEEIAGYVKNKNVQVANCSFGSDISTIIPLVEKFYRPVFGRDAFELKEVLPYANFYMNNLVKESKQHFARAKDILFVFAAGNEGTNNDIVPSSPTNVKLPNTIAVAATLMDEELANFSNYGEKMVDVAAPGVNIKSSSPGNRRVYMSGTSQAAPYVANVAGKILTENILLQSSEVKRILEETVDKKDFLKGKVKTGGMINERRAVYAAKMSLTYGLRDAISMAKDDVKELDFSSHKRRGRRPYNNIDKVESLPSDLIIL